MPKTIDIAAKEIHYLIEFKASEIKKLVKAMSMCEGGPGTTDEEKEAWRYFVGEMFPYFSEIVKGLTNDGD